MSCRAANSAWGGRRVLVGPVVGQLNLVQLTEDGFSKGREPRNPCVAIPRDRGVDKPKRFKSLDDRRRIRVGRGLHPLVGWPLRTFCGYLPFADLARMGLGSEDRLKTPDMGGIELFLVQRVLGHASATMTMDLYGHLIDANLWDSAMRIGGISGAFEPGESATGETVADGQGG